MKSTIRHYYDFKKDSELVGGNLLSAESWDRLRIEASSPSNSAFALPKDRTNWVRLCFQFPEVIASANDIGVIIRSKQFSTVVSVGVGRACVEYHLKVQLPWIQLLCTELSPRVIERLRELFIECDQVDFFDITSQYWPYFADNCLYLLYRVDTELDDRQWKTTFTNMARSGIDYVLLVPSAFLTLKTFSQELIRRWRSLLWGRRLTFSGYIRTKEVFRTFWTPYYVVEQERPIGSLTGFLLRRT
jgi:hypothetical protein